MLETITKDEQKIALRTISSHFQRSVNVSYDERNDEYIGGYIPTEAGTKAMGAILRQAYQTSPQRAHVLFAPYGSGKSLMSLVLGTMAQGQKTASLEVVFQRIQTHYPEDAQFIENYFESNKRLLPIFIQGNQGGDLRSSLIRALSLAVSRIGLAEFRPRTQFNAVLNTLERWERFYPTVYGQFSAELKQSQSTLDTFVEAINAHSHEALEQFEDLYPELTAGAVFDENAGVKLADIFHETIGGLRQVGFDGVMIIWDEFGRFMDERANQAFGVEAAQLQDFAEYCNRSGDDSQVHLVLVTHRVLSNYASDLPSDYQKEWSRIAERFWAHNVISDPAITYRLIGEAIQSTDENAWQHFATLHQLRFDQLRQTTLDYKLFGEASETDIVKRVWPLHPMTAYALPRLTREVAQNERTLFTFLAGDEPDTLRAYIQTLTSWSLISPHLLWDYFADGIRADRREGGTHLTWSGVTYALSKAPNEFSQAIIKTLGVLTIIGDVNVQTGSILGKVVASTELLAWCLQADLSVVRDYLQTLAKRRVIVYSHADGYWKFVRGSDVDLDAKVNELIESKVASKLQLRRVLESILPAPTYLPRGYNLDKSMTRFFTTIYRWHDELTGIGNDEFLKQLQPKYGYADGVVVFVLALNSADLQAAYETIVRLPPSRAIYVLPKAPLLLNEPLTELMALRDLQNDPQFMAQDERLTGEIKFFIEDASRRLERQLTPFMNLQLKQTQWISYLDHKWQPRMIRSGSQLSQLLSELCYQWFAKTPVFNIEPLNLHKPSTVQTGASVRMIDHLLRRVPDDRYPFDLGIEKNKPERLLVRSMLVLTGLLQEEEQDQWGLIEPPTEPLLSVWQLINRYLDTAIEKEQELSDLVEALQMPPFGIRRGVLPILLATALRPRMNVTTIRRNRRTVSPVTGETFQAICQSPDEFTVELGIWDERREILWRVLEEHVMDFLVVTEHEQQPLSYLSLGLLRWLQSQPRFNRDTMGVSADANQLRKLIRKATNNPTHVLFYDLLDLLEGEDSSLDSVQYQAKLAERLSMLTSEINGAYRGLLYELDRYAEETFAPNATTRQRDGHSALRYWLTTIEQEAHQPLINYRFSDPLVQRFVNVVNRDLPTGKFWESLGRAVIGVPPTDWNDASVSTFKEQLLTIKERLRQELFGLSDDDQVIELTINRPKSGEVNYRFRSSDLTQQGKNMLANFKTTMAISGRPLSPDEKRQVALAFLHFILEGEKEGDERKNKSHRVRD